MRILWTMLKVIVGLAIAVPLVILALAMALGILGALVGLAVVALKVAFFAIVAWALFRLVTGLAGSRPKRRAPERIEALPPADPHFEEAMRELDRELGHTPRS